MSLAGCSLPDLQKLRSRIATEIRKREQSSKASLLKRLTKMVNAEGFALADLLGSDPTAAPVLSRRSRGTVATKEASANAPLPPKYCHPSNRELAWSGRGRKPHWVETWMANGGSMDALAHAASLYARQSTSKRGGRATVSQETAAADQGA